jgi:Protein of unknown function with PCYCGC motif
MRSFSAGVEMQSKREWMMGSVLFAAALLLVLLPSGAGLNAKQAAVQSEEPVPAYHAQPPTEALPQTMDPTQFDNPVVKNAYALAAKVRKVLYQQPCYCHCDRAHGHTSLLNCFTTTHGAMCNVCLAEALYSYEETRKGKTATQIRQGIERGDWQHVDTAKYQNYPMKP